jgi:hypothetical protein
MAIVHASTALGVECEVALHFAPLQQVGTSSAMH